MSTATVRTEPEACLDAPRKVLATRHGAVEYAERGDGPPFLAVHGSPGGCHQGLIADEAFRAGGFRVIAPSRPGYLGTPLATGISCEAQAEAMVGLLDALELDRVAVLGMSGGGPSAYLLAAHHPDRVSCLLQVNSISMRYVEKFQAMQRLVLSRAGVATWLWLLDHFPGPVIALIVGSTADPAPRDELVRTIHSFTLSGGGRLRWRDGYTNDMRQFEQLEELPFAAITCPTMIIHGTGDRDVTPQHAVHAHERITDARLEWITGGTHPGFLFSPGTQAKALAWLASNQA